MEPKELSSVTDGLNAVGVGRSQFLLLLFCGGAWAADAMETMLLSFLGPSVRCNWGDAVTPALESALTSVVFLGMMCGVYSLGAAADAFGRKKGFLLSVLLLGSAGLASAFAPSFLWLLVLRCIVGFALGGTPIAVTLFSECAPSAKRGTFVLSLQAAWTVGTIAAALLAWAVLPTQGWRAFLAFSAIPALSLLLGYPWLPESPLWLAAQGKIQESEAVVQRLADGNGIPRGALKLRFKQQHNSINQDHRRDLTTASSFMGTYAAVVSFLRKAFSSIFGPKLAKTTSLLWFIWFVNAITYYGLVLLTTALQTEHNSDGDDGQHIKDACTADGKPAFTSKDYLAVVITSAGEAPGLLAAALLVDFKGRLWCLRIGLLTCGCCILTLLLISPTSTTLRLALLFSARASIEGTFSVLYVYTPELYPTRVRSFGLSLCNAFSRLGGLAAPFVTVFLVAGGHPKVAAGVLGCLCLTAAGAALCLPTETLGRDLELVHEDGGYTVVGSSTGAPGVADVDVEERSSGSRAHTERDSIDEHVPLVDGVQSP